MDKTQQKTLSRRRFLLRAGITIGACAAVYADARFIEPGWIDVSRHTVFLPELPLEMDGMTIAHLTDLHYGPVTPTDTITGAIALAAEAKPDLVALTGDFVNRSSQEAVALAPLLAPLRSARFGMFACLGNHDYGDRTGNSIANTLEKSGIELLRNSATPIAKNLVVAGIEDTFCGRPDTERAMESVPTRAACIFLTHNPTGVWKVTDRSCLALAGHTHGGQVRIPFLAPQLPVGMAGFPMVEGWGTFDRAQLFISRGVGLMHEPLRFRCRPEVAIITLKRGNGTPQKTSDIGARGGKKLLHWGMKAYYMFD
jgi:uncharacterized protein